jgi:hypothetical protein
MSSVPEMLSNDFLPVHTDYLSLGNISNPKVSLASMTKNGFDLIPAFTMQETYDQLFNFDIVYSRNGFAPATLTIPAKLMVKDITLTGLSFGSWSNLGLICPEYNASGTVILTVTYEGVFAEDGYFTRNVFWDNEPDGIFEDSTGVGAISHEMISVDPDNKTATFSWSFCWGNQNTVLKLDLQYLSSSTGYSSNTFSMIVPRP